MTASSAPTLEELLAHASWVNRLARRLVQDESTAEDLVQETWLTALTRPPRDARNPRAWLARVLTNAARSRGRDETRRRRREERRSEHSTAERVAPPAETVLQEAERQRDLGKLVLGLPEPYRTVLLMRFYRGASPREMARELERPLATIKTQLQRGLERLRAELDREHGERTSWVLALLPLARRASAPATSAATLASALVVLTVAAGVLAAVRLLAAPDPAPRQAPGTLAARAASPLASDPPAPGAAPTLSLPADDAAASAAALRTAASTTSTEPAPASSSPVATQPYFARLVGHGGRPLPGVEVEWHERGRLHWADAAESALSAESFWLPVSAARRAAWVADPAALAAAAEEYGLDALDLAGLARGATLPNPRTTTDGDGRFRFEVRGGGDFVLCDERLWCSPYPGAPSATREPGPGMATYLVLPSHELGGVLVDRDGTPVRDAGLVGELWLPADPEVGRPEPLTVLGLAWSRTDEAGRFHAPRFPAVGVVSFAARLASGRRVPLTELRERDAAAEAVLRLTLPARAGPPRSVRGVVLFPEGSPVPRATVAFGHVTAITGEDGRYRLELEDEFDLPPDPDAWGLLVALRPGSGVCVRAGLADELAGFAGEVELRPLVLPGEDVAIEGRVLDAAGEPLAGVAVGLLDGTPHRALSGSIEDVAGARALGTTRTDDEGRFRLGGLLPREYRVVCYELELVSSPTAAGRTDLVLRAN